MALTKKEQEQFEKNKEYWIKRWKEHYLKNEDDFKVIEKNLKDILKNVNKKIQDELFLFYSKKEYLTDSEIFQNTQTINAIGKVLLEFYQEEEKTLNEFLEKEYKEIYENTLVDLGAMYNTINVGLVKQAVATNWSGLSFSDRIWANRDKLVLEIKEEITKAFIRGDSLQDISYRLTDKLNNTFSNAMRLIRTETCAIQMKSTIDSYKESGVVEKFEFSAFIDSKTSPQCKELDGRTFSLEEGIIGTNIPPLHPNCRSCILPVVERTGSSEGIKDKENVNNDKLNKEYPSFGDRFELKDSELTKYGLEYVKNLPKEEYDDLRYYTGSGYSDINRQLRRGDDYGQAKKINNISKAIKKFNAPQDFLAHRGTTYNALKGLFNTIDDFNSFMEIVYDEKVTEEYINENLIGNVLVDKAFMSTSALESGSFTKDIGLHIRIDKGSNYGAYINELSNFKDGEYEYLLDKNLLMEIQDVKVVEHGRLEFYLGILGYAD